MGRHSVLIVDDHPVVLSGLRLLFAGDQRFAIVGEAATVAVARARAEALQPDLIVTDLVLGGDDGIALIEDMRAMAPAARIVVYSSHDEALWARHALRAGARGYVSKAGPLEDVAAAAEAILRGETHVSPAVRRLLDDGANGTSDIPHDVGALSARELQVLILMGGGSSLQTLGRELGLSVKTVGTYRERLKIKLGFDTIRLLERFAADHVAGRAPGR